MLAYFINIMSGPGFTILNGIGMPKYGMLSSMLAAALNLVLSVTLVLAFGYYGVVWGTSLSMMAGAGFFMYEFHRVMKLPFSGMAARVLGRPLLAVLPVSLAAVLLVRARPGMGWVTLACLSTAFLAAFTALALLLRCFDDFDMALIKDCLARARRRFGYAEWGALP
jgi:O-antigen/teichoic acid export membrane protein